MRKLTLEQSIERKSTRCFKCVVCGEILFRVDQVEHILKHNLTIKEYKLLSNKKKSELLKSIRGSKEQRKLTSNISKRQWASYGALEKESRVANTIKAMKSSEQYVNRGYKISESKQLTPEKNSLAIKNGWNNMNPEDRKLRIYRSATSQIGKVISKEQCELASTFMKQYHKDHPEFKRKFILAGQTAAGSITFKGSKLELAIRDYLKEAGITSIKHNIGKDRHMIVVINKSYIPDFIDIENKIIIEANGCYFHGCPTCKPNETKKYDKSNNRINALRAAGYSVLEIWEHEIKDGSYKGKINNFINRRHYALA